MDRSHPRGPVHLGVAQLAAHMLREHGVAGSRPAAETNQKRVLGCGRSSMAELRDVTPPVPVRLRPVTPKRMRYQCVANSSGRVPGSYPGMSGLRALRARPSARTSGASNAPERVERAPGDAPATTPSWRNRQTHRSQKPEPATGMSVRLGPRGPIFSSPVAQRQSSALIRRRPVDRTHPGRPGCSTTTRGGVP